MNANLELIDELKSDIHLLDLSLKKLAPDLFGKFGGKEKREVGRLARKYATALKVVKELPPSKRKKFDYVIDLLG